MGGEATSSPPRVRPGSGSRPGTGRVHRIRHRRPGHRDGDVRAGFQVLTGEQPAGDRRRRGVQRSGQRGGDHAIVAEVLDRGDHRTGTVVGGRARGCSWICSGRSISRAGPSGTTRPGSRRTSMTPSAQCATSRSTTPGTVQVSPMNSAVGRSTGWSYTSRGRPTWASAPPRMIAIWSAKDSASSWSCVTSRVVTSVAASAAATSARVSARNDASSAENGSSSRISFGSGARVLASATRCCWPPDSSCG